MAQCTAPTLLFTRLFTALFTPFFTLFFTRLFTPLFTYFVCMRIYLTILSCLVAGHLAAQQSLNPTLERVTNDCYTRSHDYDLVHQRIAVSNFDWDSIS